MHNKPIQPFSIVIAAIGHKAADAKCRERSKEVEELSTIIWLVSQNRFFPLKVPTHTTFPNLTSLWSESAQAEPMEDLVRRSRWEAWVMGNLVCTFWGKM